MKKRSEWMYRMVVLLLGLMLAMPLNASAAAKVKLSKTSVTLVKGKTCTLKVTGTKKKVKWSSSKTSVATVSTKGKVTAKKKGTATITAKVGGKSYKCTVKVKQPVTGVKLSGTSAVLVQGRTLTLKAAVSPTNADKKTVTWSSSNSSVVTVSKAGKLKAVAPGTAVVTAAAADGSKKKASCKVKVEPVMTISQKTVTLEVGEVKNLSVGDTSGAQIVWGSSAPSVVSVSGGKLIGAKEGSAVVTAQKADGSQSVSCKVTVTAQKQQTEPSEAAKQFLAILQKYSDQVKADKKKGKLWGYSNSSKLNPKTWTAAEAALEAKGVTYNNCALLVRIAMREMGILGESQNFWGTPEGGIHFNSGVAATVRQHCQIISAYQTPNELLAEGKLLPGDICTWAYSFNHTNVYAGNGLWYDAGRGGDGSYVKKTTLVKQYGLKSSNLVSDGSDKTSMYIFNSFGPCATVNMNSGVVGQIIRIVK